MRGLSKFSINWIGSSVCTSELLPHRQPLLPPSPLPNLRWKLCIYIYMCVGVCVFRERERERAKSWPASFSQLTVNFDRMRSKGCNIFSGFFVKFTGRVKPLFHRPLCKSLQVGFFVDVSFRDCFLFPSKCILPGITGLTSATKNRGKKSAGRWSFSQ